MLLPSVRFKFDFFSFSKAMFICFASGQIFKTYPPVRKKNTQTQNETALTAYILHLISLFFLHISEAVISTSSINNSAMFWGMLR